MNLSQPCVWPWAGPRELCGYIGCDQAISLLAFMAAATSSMSMASCYMCIKCLQSKVGSCQRAVSSAISLQTYQASGLQTSHGIRY